MRKSTALSFLSALCLLFFLSLALTSCEEDPCEDAVCASCPSSRVLVEYQDSTGACPPAFSAAGMVYGIDLLTMDTALRYNFSDSCMAGLILRENYRYVVRSGTYSDVFDVLGFTYQEPLEVTECCLCYPVANVDLSINGDSTRIDFPTGEYQNTPYVISIN